MSSTIEFCRWVLSTTINIPYSKPLLFGFVEQGDSNVIEHSGNRIARNIGFCQVADKYEFMQNVVRRSVSCESGSLRMNGRACKPENYIAAWRKTVMNAVSIDAYLSHDSLLIQFRSLADAIELKRSSLDLTQSWAVEKDSLLGDLKDLLGSTDGIEEKTDIICGEKYPITEIILTLENYRGVIDLISQLMNEGVDFRTWRTGFDENAYDFASHCINTKSNSGATKQSCLKG